MQLSRTWRDNAAEFGALSRQGSDVRLALLAACSVEEGIGNGGDPNRHRSERYGAKVSANEFARWANTSATRINRHIKAWNRLADLGLVVPAEELHLRDAEGLRAFKDDDSFLADEDGAWRAAFAHVSKRVNAEEPPGSRPRSTVAEIDGALVDKEGYAAKLVTGLSDAGFAALVEAIEEATTPVAPEVDPDLPPPPPSKPTKKREVVDDWASRKAKADLAARQAELDAQLAAAKLDAIANGGRVTSEGMPEQPEMFPPAFTAWSVFEQRFDEAMQSLQAKRREHGLIEWEQERVRALAVLMLDVAEGRVEVTSTGVREARP